MTADDVQYFAAAIQFAAVPIGAIEFMTPERRQNLELWLVTQLPQILKAFVLMLGLLYVMVVLLVKAGPYVAIAYFMFGGLIVIVLSGDNPMESAIISWILGLVILTMAALEKWVLPVSWVLAIGMPYEHFSMWANTLPGMDWILPDYSGQAFLKNYQDTFTRIEDWLWDWLAFANVGYFFVSRGLMLLAVIVIQLSLFGGIALAGVLSFLVPVELIILVSDRLKKRLHIAEGQIPIAAFVLFVLGETLDFGTQTFCRWTSMCG